MSKVPLKFGSAVVPSPIRTENQRSIPSIAMPSPTVLAPTTTTTDTYTYFTKAVNEEQQLYTGDRAWAQVKVTLETAGPVAVATKQNFLPVLSGKGTLLTTGQEKVFTLPKGARLWIAATAVNRVSVIVEPFPWFEQMYAVQANDANASRAILDLVAMLPKNLANALAQLIRGGK